MDRLHGAKAARGNEGWKAKKRKAKKPARVLLNAAVYKPLVVRLMGVPSLVPCLQRDTPLPCQSEQIFGPRLKTTGADCESPPSRYLEEMAAHSDAANPCHLPALFTLARGQQRPYQRERKLYRQPTRGGFSTVGTIVTIHRCGLRDRSSWTDRTMPKNLDPFKLSSATRPLYRARRQRVASRKLLVSTVCKVTSSGHPQRVSVKR